MPRVAGHYRKVGNKRVHVKGYIRKNPRVRAHNRKATHVRRHWRKKAKK